MVRSLSHSPLLSLLLWVFVMTGLLGVGRALAQLSWEPLGPEREVNVVAVSPATGDTILVCAFEAYTRQVNRTDDGGTTWASIPGLSGVYDVVIDPEHPSIVHAVGDTVYRSTDGGVTWHRTTGDIGARVLTLSPDCSRRLYVGTASGRVLRSSTWGASWADIGIDPPLGSYEWISDIVTDPGDSNVIYASTFDHEWGGTGIYRTSDGGGTWQSLGFPGEEGQPPGPIRYVSQLHMSQDNPDRLLAGAGVYNFGVTGAIYETADGGANWNTLALSGVPYNDYLRTYILEPLPHRRDTIFFGFDHWGGPQYIYYSIDSGRGWSLLVDFIENESEHGMDIALDDLSRVYYTTGAGVVRSAVPSSPSVAYVEHAVDDVAGGDGNGHIDPGETILLEVAIRSRFGTASGVSATLVSPDVFISIAQPFSTFPDMAWGGGATTLDPYEFSIHPARLPGPAEFTLEIAGDGFQATEVFFVDPHVLLVDDDDFGAHEAVYKQALEAGHLAYRTWHIVPDGPVNQSLLDEHDAVVWFTSDMQPGIKGTTLGAEEELLLADYLDGGGSLFLSSQDYLNEAIGGLSDFAANYLHAGGRFLDTSNPGAVGIPGDPIGDGVLLDPLDYHFLNLSDSVFPDGDAAKVMDVLPGIGGAAIRYPAAPGGEPFRTVFFAFPFEAIPEGGVAPNTRGTIMKRILEWLVPEGGLVPTGVVACTEPESSTDAPVLSCRPNPSRGSVQFELNSTSGDRDALLSMYSTAGRLVWHASAGRESDGSLSVVWDGRDMNGAPVASGIYFVRALIAGREVQGRIVLVR